MLRAIRPRPIFSMRSTDGERHYILVVNADGVSCNCPAGEFRVDCKHARRVRASINRRIREAARRAS